MNRQEQIEKLEKRLQELKSAENRKKRKERTREMCVFAGNVEKSFKKVFEQNLWGQDDKKGQVAFIENALLKLFESYKQENKELPTLVSAPEKTPETDLTPAPVPEPEKKELSAEDVSSFLLDDDEDEDNDLHKLLDKYAPTTQPESW